MEALDAWTRAKEDGLAEAPKHEVVISTLAGASGGAINGAMMLRAAGWSFEHGAVDSNPFFSAWTKGVDLERLLSADKENEVSGFASVLNCAPLDEQARHTMEFKGEPLGTNGSPSHRSYFADPLRLIAMTGNVTGVPYTITLKGSSGLSHDLLSHADQARFALAVDGGLPGTPVP